MTDWVCSSCTSKNNTSSHICTECELKHYTVHLTFPTGEVIKCISSSMSTIKKIKKSCIKNDNMRRQLIKLYNINNGEDVLLDDNIISDVMTNEENNNSPIILFALERSDPFTIVPFNDLQIVCNFLGNYKQLPRKLDLIEMRNIQQLFLPLFSINKPVEIPTQSTIDDFAIKNQFEFIKCLSILDPYFDNNLTSKYADVFCRILSKLLILTFKNPFFWINFPGHIKWLPFHLDFCIKFAKLIALEEELIYPIPISTITPDRHLRLFYVWNNNSYNSILLPKINQLCGGSGPQLITEITSDEFIKLKTSQNRTSISISPEVDILLNK